MSIHKSGAGLNKFETLSKKDKDIKAAEWLMETEGKNTRMSARASQPLSF